MKRMFKLPDFIEATGISKLRDPMAEKDSIRMIRQKLKERMNPRLGKIDIDYEVLHDAFFKHQTKPFLTIFGDIYYEGKEEEQKMRMFKPGKVSRQLRAALGMAENAPPPWVSNMQKYGPPPSYPNLKIQGLSNALLEFLAQKKKGANEGNEIMYNRVDEGFLWGKAKDEEEYKDEEGYEGIQNEIYDEN
jgi:splicing factor 3B subunit 2